MPDYVTHAHQFFVPDASSVLHIVSWAFLSIRPSTVVLFGRLPGSSMLPSVYICIYNVYIKWLVSKALIMINRCQQSFTYGLRLVLCRDRLWLRFVLDGPLCRVDFRSWPCRVSSDGWIKCAYSLCTHYDHKCGLIRGLPTFSATVLYLFLSVSTPSLSTVPLVSVNCIGYSRGLQFVDAPIWSYCIV